MLKDSQESQRFCSKQPLTVICGEFLHHPSTLNPILKCLYLPAKNVDFFMILRLNDVFWSCSELMSCTTLSKIVGTIDFYEFLMAVALLNTDDPEKKMTWLFSLCDSDRDGLVNQDEVVEVLAILTVIGHADPASAEPSEIEVQQTKSLLEAKIKEFARKIFDDKTQVNENEFGQRFPEKEAQFINGVARYLSIATLNGAL